MELYEAVSPLDFRYYGSDPTFMKRLLPYVSEAGYVTYQAKVEAALVRTLANYGVCTSAIADEGGASGRHGNGGRGSTRNSPVSDTISAHSSM